MFNSLISKFRHLFGSALTSPPPQPVVPKPAPSLSGKVVTNRVVYAPQKPAQPTKSPLPQSVAAVSVTLETAKRLEAAAAAKETEIFNRLKSLDSREQYLLQKEKTLDTHTEELRNKLAAVDELYRKQLDKLEQISGIDVEKAKQLILSATEKKMAAWIAKKIVEARQTLEQKKEEIGREVLSDSLRHGVTDYVAEYTVSTITLPDEKIKGKIIGREGRNIRAFEKATGVELELDESNDIRISSFDSTRREIARLALEKLIRDGRIQPVRIEQLVEQTKNEMDKILLNEGKKICQEVGIYNLPIELMKHVGKYKFRFSYGQNLAKHTIEATKIAVALANELRADVNTVRLGALLHDIGKVVSDQEGTHIDLGIDLLRQYKLPQAVINTVSEHHQEQDFSSAESVLVYLGDAASGARPGARYEIHEEYLKRMKNIEEIAKSFPGVLSVAAYQAGREVMVIVEPTQVSDAESQVLSQNIAEKLEEEAKWAGQIRVTVIRELRVSSVVVGSKINKNAEKIT